MIEENDKEDCNNSKGREFLAPDGGWGWMIIIASGFSNFFLLPILQSFGLIFRDFFHQLGISASRTASLININCAIMSCIGLANGPLYRKYSYRQVCLFGSVISAISISVLSVMKTYMGFLIFFSLLYAAGTGLAMSANTLALNAYFYNKRRLATGLSWAFSGISTILMPQMITILMPLFGVQGTVLIYGGLTFNAIACALLLQPVSWHMPRRKKRMEEEVQFDSTSEIQLHRKGEASEIDKISNSPLVPNLIDKWQDFSSQTAEDKIIIIEESGSTATSIRKSILHRDTEEQQELKDERRKYQCIRQILKRVHSLLDLDLLRDPIYVNLTLGLNFANFAEINFALLTPFILGEYGFTTHQIATVMSVLAGMDVLSRFAIPFVTALIKWQNRTFFLVGIFAMALGRIVLAHSQNYIGTIAVSILIGAGKGLRTIFIALVIPSHVPLARLPAAIGIHLLISGIVLLSMGPLVGWVRDISGNYTFTLHFLNLFTYLTVISWTLEIYWNKKIMHSTTNETCTSNST
ncbi:monocarboxylate transporter 13-like [Prorops nasuta]|uniref:monocarboxylate transporter 13-like n=1 Tax=Prorops nasuta TaxID=863751 RepID=UPI0034CD78F5